MLTITINDEVIMCSFQDSIKRNLLHDRQRAQFVVVQKPRGKGIVGNDLTCKKDGLVMYPVGVPVRIDVINLGKLDQEIMRGAVGGVEDGYRARVDMHIVCKIRIDVVGSHDGNLMMASWQRADGRWTCSR